MLLLDAGQMTSNVVMTYELRYTAAMTLVLVITSKANAFTNWRRIGENVMT